MGRRRRVEQTSPQRDWHASPARAPCDIDPETGAPDPPYIVGDRDLMPLSGAALEKVQADVERWERDNPRYSRNPDGQLERVDYPTYEELDAEGKRLADDRMVRKFKGLVQ